MPNFNTNMFLKYLYKNCYLCGNNVIKMASKLWLIAQLRAFYGNTKQNHANIYWKVFL
jgi:hypothetical protein